MEKNPEEKYLLIPDYPKIPKCLFPDTSNILICENQEPLVDFNELCKDNHRFYLPTASYFMQGQNGAIDRYYVRQQVAELLIQAAELLPEGLRLKIYDAWRPKEVQLALYNEYEKQLLKRNENKGITKEQLRTLTTQFVSYPSDDPHKPFVHSTGGAIDLTIVDEEGMELDMGTSFDDFTEKANTAYYESVIESIDQEDQIQRTRIRDHRRMLYYIMTKVGFTNLPTEWWHYDYGDTFWSHYKQKTAIYQGIFHRM